MTVFVKTMKIHYVLKGLDENPQTGITKKRAQQQKAGPGRPWFRCRILYKSVWNVYKCQAKTSGRGQSGSTIIIYSFYPRATPFFPDKELLSERASSPTSWGEFKFKEPPVLPIPSYPALCREDTTSWNHGRPGTNLQESPGEPGRTQESPGELKLHEDYQTL